MKLNAKYRELNYQKFIKQIVTKLTMFHLKGSLFKMIVIFIVTSSSEEFLDEKLSAELQSF